MGTQRKARFLSLFSFFSWLNNVSFWVQILKLFLDEIADSFSCLAKFSWSKSLVGKWFNIRSKTEEFQADEVVYGGQWF